MQGITHGRWRYEPANYGFSGDFYEPPDPGHPASVYSEVEAFDSESGRTIIREVPIAMMEEPSYDDGGEAPMLVGDMDVNARFLALAPEMYRKLLAVSDAMTQCGYDAQDDPPGSPWRGLYGGINELLAQIRGEG